MRYLRFFALAAVAVLSTGCLRATYTLNLKPDGSGTIHQTMAMTSMAMQQAAMMAGESGSLIPTEAKLREAAEGMGTGVRFVSSARGRPSSKPCTVRGPPITARGSPSSADRRRFAAVR